METRVTIQGHILKSDTSILPLFKVPEITWLHIKNLTITDTEFYTSRPVDIIIGADSCGDIEPSIIKGDITMPIAQLSVFGWLILDPVKGRSSAQVSTHMGTTQSAEEMIKQLLTQF